MNSERRLAIGLLASAIALRPLAVAVGPVLPEIQADLAFGPAISGVLGMIPVLCLGLFAPAGAQLAMRVGPQRALGIAVLLTIIFGAARSAAPEVIALILTTVGLGVGMGLAGSISAILIKVRATDRPAFMTGMYATGVVSGAALGALLIVPLAELGGGWRGGMILLSLPVVVVVLFGYRLLGRDPGRPSVRGRSSIPWGDSRAWLLAAIFGVQSLLYWSLVFWLADVLIAMGWPPTAAGTMVALFQVLGLGAVLATGYVADRFGTRRIQLQAVSGAFAIGLVGLALAPGIAVLWLLLVGIASGAALPLALTLPVDYGRDARDAGSKASLMLLAGYLVAAAGPPAVGLVRAATTAVEPVFLFLAAVSVLFFVLASALRPPPDARPRPS